MKTFAKVVGVLLVLLGIFGLVYGGFSYTSQDEVAQVGDVTITTETDDAVYIPPVFSGLCIGVGILLFVVARRR